MHSLASVVIVDVKYFGFLSGCRPCFSIEISIFQFLDVYVRSQLSELCQFWSIFWEIYFVFFSGYPWHSDQFSGNCCNSSTSWSVFLKFQSVFLFLFFLNLFTTGQFMFTVSHDIDANQLNFLPVHFLYNYCFCVIFKGMTVIP